MTPDALARARRRLVAFLALSLLLVAAALTIALAHEIDVNRQAALDTQVERAAVAADAILGPDSKNPGQVDLSTFTSTPHVQGDPLLAVLDTHGSQIAGEDFTGAAAARAAVDLGRRDIENAITVQVSGRTVRMAARPILNDSGDTIGTAVAFQPTADTDSTVRNDTLLLAGGVAVAVLLIIATGWLITGRAIAPAQESAAREQAFLADAAHELRTPIAVMRARAEHALALDAGAEAAPDLQAIVGAADGAARTIADMLELARLDAGAARLRRERLRLDALADTVAEDLREAAATAGAEIVVDAPEQVLVDGDERLLARAVANLIENAIRHGGGNVRVAVGQAGGHAELTVADRGPGVPPSQSSRIFDRFHRAQAGSAGGAGLGLPIARLVAEAHGGELQLSTPEQYAGGARFVLTLPLARVHGSGRAVGEGDI